jgi:hypothetical protein
VQRAPPGADQLGERGRHDAARGAARVHKLLLLLLPLPLLLQGCLLVLLLQGRLLLKQLPLLKGQQAAAGWRPLWRLVQKGEEARRVVVDAVVVVVLLLLLVVVVVLVAVVLQQVWVVQLLQLLQLLKVLLLLLQALLLLLLLLRGPVHGVDWAVVVAQHLVEGGCQEGVRGGGLERPLGQRAAAAPQRSRVAGPQRAP